MKAAQINEYGDISKIKLVEIEKPTVQNKQVLVKIHASSINPFDTKFRKGEFKEMAPVAFPITLGNDFAGEIAEIGADVTGFKVGDKVFGHANAVFDTDSGSYAEYAVISENHITKMPKGIDFTQAASFVVVGVSAIDALMGSLKLTSGQKLFIHGGSGSVGVIAIQLAKYLGAHVTVTATDEGISLARKFGADEVIDYKKQNYKEIVHGVDAVLDLVGSDFSDHLSLLKKGGMAVSLLDFPDQAKAELLGVRAEFLMVDVNADILNTLSSLIEKGTIVSNISRVFPFSEIKEAFSIAENSKTRGKLVITMG